MNDNEEFNTPIYDLVKFLDDLIPDRGSLAAANVTLESRLAASEAELLRETRLAAGYLGVLKALGIAPLLFLTASMILSLGFGTLNPSITLTTGLVGISLLILIFVDWMERRHGRWVFQCSAHYVFVRDDR